MNYSPDFNAGQNTAITKTSGPSLCVIWLFTEDSNLTAFPLTTILLATLSFPWGILEPLSSLTLKKDVVCNALTLLLLMQQFLGE